MRAPKIDILKMGVNIQNAALLCIVRFSISQKNWFYNRFSLKRRFSNFIQRAVQ